LVLESNKEDMTWMGMNTYTSDRERVLQQCIN